MTGHPALARPRTFTLLIGVLASLVLVLSVQTPAGAATDRPAQVGLVSFVGAGLTDDGGASLTVSWPAVKSASSYEVFVGSTYSNVLDQKSPRVRSTTTKATVRGLDRGRDYFVQVRAINKAGKAGNKSSRVGHGTIRAEGSGSSSAQKLLTWNICSNKCSRFSSRQKLINTRIAELSPTIVTLQESILYTKAPSGYGFAYKGRNAVLYDKDRFRLTVRGEQTTFSARYSEPGGGVSWGALQEKSTGDLKVVFSVHLKTGTSSATVKQRVYESGQVARVVRSTMAMLRAEYPTKDWSTASTYVAGDINSHKSRTRDATLSTLEKGGWFDAFDQARTLVKQHQNTAHSSGKATPTVSIRWGDHIDKVLVQPGKTVVSKWSNVQKMSKGKYVKLASDHLPLMVWLRTEP